VRLVFQTAIRLALLLQTTQIRRVEKKLIGEACIHSTGIPPSDDEITIGKLSSEQEELGKLVKQHKNYSDLSRITSV
jgi:hypothetical protein